MNQLLQVQYAGLGAEEKQELKHRLRDSPRALSLLRFLDDIKDRKLNTMEVVESLYSDSSEKFEVNRNRFFKLRKQLIGLLEGRRTGSNHSNSRLMPLEEKFYHCRKLIIQNHYQVAKQELKELVKECREQNIFEWWSEALSQLIYCDLALNLLKDVDELSDEMVEASKLLHDLRSMQALSRKTYYHILSREYGKVDPLLKHMRRIAIRRMNYPRFRMFYHFVVISNTAGLPDISTKATARHFTALKRLMNKYPGMPVGQYEPDWMKIVQFYLHTSEGTYHYMRGNVHKCYAMFRESWDIQDRSPDLRVRKSESTFANRIAIEVATGRFREALHTAERFIEFQKEQHQEERRLKGYADMAMIYTYAWPSLVCKDPGFINSRLNELVSIMKKNNSVTLDEVIAIQATFAFMCGDYKRANKLAANTGSMKIFKGMGMEVYNDILRMNESNSEDEANAMIRRVEQLLHRSVSADRTWSFKRAINLLGKLKKDL